MDRWPYCAPPQLQAQLLATAHAATSQAKRCSAANVTSWLDGSNNMHHQQLRHRHEQHSCAPALLQGPWVPLCYAINLSNGQQTLSVVHINVHGRALGANWFSCIQHYSQCAVPHFTITGAGRVVCGHIAAGSCQRPCSHSPCSPCTAYFLIARMTGLEMLACVSN